MREIFLMMVTSEANHNKYYRMIDKEDGSGNFEVEYGRVGANPARKTYSLCEWDKKYNEKVRKGYVDQTGLFATVSSDDNLKDNIPAIIKELIELSRKIVRQNYACNTRNVTQAMIDEAQSVINQLVSETSLFNFNKELERLFGIIPRVMSNVKDHLAKDSSDFNSIIQNEQQKLDALKSQVVVNSVQTTNDDEKDDDDLLSKLGIKVEDVNDPSVISQIKDLLGEERNRFVKAWKVTNEKTEKLFRDNLGNKQTKLLWHGSRNENWWSILQTGLVLRPTNVVISGKMFGYGIYFAPKARKSVGYTSIYGSYWANGNSNKAFMALFECAYGNPLDVYQHNSSYYNYTQSNLGDKYDCLHAPAGSSLRNDEIIFYKQSSLTIRYLVEIR